MIKLLIIFLFLVLFPLTISAQSIKIEDKHARRIINKIEQYPVEIIQVKTLKKYKALGLSSEMKSKMNYNVVRVKYKTPYALKTVIIDMHLVPIEVSSKIIMNKYKEKNDYISWSLSNYN